MVKENKKELPVIIPIIVYHGKPSWNYKKDIVRKTRELVGKGGRIMTLLEKIEQEGIEKGIEKGKRYMVEEFMRAGAEEALIVKASKLSIEEVEKIKKEMKK